MKNTVYLLFACLFGVASVAAQPAPTYQNPDAPIAVRVADLLGRMTPEEKFWQLFMIPAGGDARLFGDDAPDSLRARASTGRLGQFTGVSAPYEEPTAPELTIDTRVTAPDTAASMVIDFLRRQRLIDV